MDWCSVYLTPEGLPKYIYLSPPLICPTTYNGIRTKNRPVWITPGAVPIHWIGPIRNPRCEQKRTEGYVIVSNVYLEVRERRGHIFFEWNKCLWFVTLAGSKSGLRVTLSYLFVHVLLKQPSLDFIQHWFLKTYFVSVNKGSKFVLIIFVHCCKYDM